MARLEIQEIRSLHVGPLSLSLAGGECLALWGPSGVGKTLLLRAIADLDPHGGEVLLDGKPQGESSGPAWRRRVGYLPAESAWWAERVADHFSCGEERVRDELDSLGLERGCFGWEVERLSSGERQRLALLRLLTGEPDALLLDEPTANLDPDMTTAVERIVMAYREEREASVLWVSHDSRQRARIADRAIEMAASAPG